MRGRGLTESRPMRILCGIGWAVWVLLVSCVCTAARADELDQGWILCMPDSEVNIRSQASKHSEIIGRCFLGDMIQIDRRRGEWVHAVGLACEAGEGWIKASFVDEWEPTVYVDGVPAQTKVGHVNARYCIGGKVRKTLKRGAEVTVWAESADMAVTNRGYIRSEYLERTVAAE